MSYNKNITGSEAAEAPLAPAKGAAADAAARVLGDLATAAEMIENGAFDLAGHAHADTVSDLIRVAGDLRGLIEELAPRAAR